MKNYNLKYKIMRSEYGTQRAFANAIGVDETRVSQVVNGRYNLTEEEMSAWAAVLKCSPELIFKYKT
jgi:plasmid maintenance system antidote protein VapI